jgi:hypothetical protein
MTGLMKEKYLVRKLLQNHYVHQNHYMDWPGTEPAPTWWEIDRSRGTGCVRQVCTPDKNVENNWS